MNLLDLMVRIGVDDQATSRIGKITGSIKSGLGGAVKAGAAAMTAATAAAGAGVAAMGKAALDSYASYEQLAGGVEKLYGQSSETLKAYADQAYQTAGMSANEYMETATQFSSSLIKSLDGDTAKAADQTDKAMRLISDNVNVFGSNAVDVQNAIKGISRENYTMVDNLKLGYAGTKEGMAQLIADANEYAASQGKAADLQMGNFSDMIDAIQLIQEKQGIAGTTAKEAATTIEGSINMTKAAWTNLLTEFGKEDGDVGKRVTELVDSATTALLGHVDEKTGEVEGGIIPRVMQIIQSIAAQLPSVIPQLVEVGTQVFGALVEAVTVVAPTLLQSVVQMIQDAARFISENKVAIADGAIDAFLAILDALTQVAPLVLSALVELLLTIVGRILERSPEIFNAALELVAGLVRGLGEGIGSATEAAREVAGGVLEGVRQFFEDMEQAGYDLVTGLVNGILSAPGRVWDAITGVVGNGIEQAKRLLGIASPSKVFAEIGRNTMLGLEGGIEGESDRVQDAMARVSNSLSANADVGISGVPTAADRARLIAPTAGAGRPITVILELDRVQLGRAVYQLNNDETQRVGVKLAGGFA